MDDKASPFKFKAFWIPQSAIEDNFSWLAEKHWEFVAWISDKWESHHMGPYQKQALFRQPSDGEDSRGS